MSEENTTDGVSGDRKGSLATGIEDRSEFGEFIGEYDEGGGGGEEEGRQDHEDQEGEEKIIEDQRKPEKGKPGETKTYLQKPKPPRPMPFDNSEIFQLILGETRVPFRKNLPNVEFYKEEAYIKNPLLQYHSQDVRIRNIHKFLQAIAVKKKIETYYDRDLEEDVENVPTGKFYFEQLLRDYAQNLPTVGLQDSWIKSIYQKLHNLHLKFPSIANTILEEVRESFRKSMHEFGVECIMKPLPGDVREKHELLASEEVGKTDKYYLYLRRREAIKSRLHITHHYQRKIYALCVRILPEILTDLTKHRNLGVVDMNRVKQFMLGDIKKGEHIVTTALYPKMVAMISRKRALNNIPATLRPRYLASATNILAVQVRFEFKINQLHIPEFLILIQALVV